MPPKFEFADKHRIQGDLQVDDDGDRLVVGPVNTRFAPIAITLVGFFAALLGFFAWMNWGRMDSGQAIFVPTFAVVILTFMLTVIRYIFRYEYAKGPVLEVHRASSLVILPREQTSVTFDNFMGMTLRIDQYHWHSDELDLVAELSLLVDTPDNGLQIVPVVMVLNQIEEFQEIAADIAEILGLMADPNDNDNQVRMGQLAWLR